MSLAIDPSHVHSDESDCLLSLVGDIDLACAPHIAGPLTTAVATASAARVTIDLGRVTFMDATGLTLLVRIRNAAQARGRVVCLLAVPPGVARLIECGGLAAAFGTVDKTAPL